MRRHRLATSACLPLCLLAAQILACAAEEPPAPPPPEGPRLVVLYLGCTVSKAFLSPYSGDVDFTPNLEAFAGEGLVFDRHQSEAGTTGIAVASVLTGSQSLHHGVYGHPQPLADETVILPEAFAEAGYETFYYDRHLMASAKLGYGQGVPPLNVYRLRVLEPGDRYLAKILKRLAEDPAYRAFVMVIYSTTHWPYSDHVLDAFCAEFPHHCEPAPGRDADDFERFQALYHDDDNFLRLAYDHENRVRQLGLTPEDLVGYDHALTRLFRANIHYLDTLFGGAVADIRQAGLLDESLIVFTADHGEVTGRTNAVFPWTHGHTLAPEVLGVPLLIRGPQAGVPTGRFDGVTRSIDVFPTVAGLAGIPLPEGAAPGGTDLSAAIRGEAPPPTLPAFSHTAVLQESWVDGVRDFPFFHGLYPRTDAELVWVSLREGDLVFKYRNLGDERFGFEAFDLASDPEERRDRFDAGDPRHAEIGERLRSYKAALVRDWKDRAEGSAQRIPDVEQIELLKSIGYIP